MAKNWREVRAAAALDEGRVAAKRRQLDRAIQAHRLAEIRRRRSLTQSEVATAMGVQQPRISQIERGDLDVAELATLKAYVAALGGELQIVADFGEEKLVIA